MKANPAVTAKFNDINDSCFDKCVSYISSKPKTAHEYCMESCIKKIVSGMDFMYRYEKTGGIIRKINNEENKF